ncbi:MAG TPA: hypothetical protein VIP48_10515, partial [Streptosporangiaceae bacterium]
MNAVVLVDPIEYQRHRGESTDPPALLRTLHFGHHHQGLVTFLVYPGGPESEGLPRLTDRARSGRAGLSDAPGILAGPSGDVARPESRRTMAVRYQLVINCV